MAQRLILIRGIPGSGKSTKAKELVANSPDKLSQYEADMFFVNAHGEYGFDPKLLTEAHAWCYECTERDLKNRLSVVVANTFTRLWEMQKYRTR